MASDFNPPSTFIAGLRCRCPRCGEGPLFKDFLSLHESCPRCGQSFAFADPADGPAFFVMTAIGIIVIAAWTVWVIAAQPPIWAQFAVVFPTMIAAMLGTLRPVKAWLVAEQFVHKAEEARWHSLGAHGKAPDRYDAGRW